MNEREILSRRGAKQEIDCEDQGANKVDHKEAYDSGANERHRQDDKRSAAKMEKLFSIWKLLSRPENQIRVHLCYQHKIRSKISGFSKFLRSLLYSRLWLYQLEVRPLWKTAHALG